MHVTYIAISWPAIFRLGTRVAILGFEASYNIHDSQHAKVNCH